MTRTTRSFHYNNYFWDKGIRKSVLVKAERRMPSPGSLSNGTEDIISIQVAVAECSRSCLQGHIHGLQEIWKGWRESFTMLWYQPNPAHSIDKYETSCFSSSHPQSKWVFFVAVPRRPWATISIGRKAATGDSITVAVKWEWYLRGSPIQKKLVSHIRAVKKCYNLPGYTKYSPPNFIPPPMKYPCFQRSLKTPHRARSAKVEG